MKKQTLEVDKLSIIRHDLKTPLTILQIYLESMEKYVKSGEYDKLSELVSKSKKSVSNFVKIIDRSKS